MYPSVIRHSFSSSSISREIRSDDFWKYGLDKALLNTRMDSAAKKYADNQYRLETLKVIPRLNGKHLVITNDFEDNLIIRKSNKVLRQFTNYRFFERNDEVRQILSLIRTEPAAMIFRTDISSFFESINFEKVLHQLIEDGFNNLPVLKVLESINRKCLEHDISGLPRGLSISSTLSDYYMRNFDKAMRLIDTCFYYTRYVDDVLMLYTSETINLKKLVIENLPNGLSLNLKKTQMRKICKNQYMEYLGYNLCLNDYSEIKISRQKINKTKTRIALSLIQFNRDRKYNILFKRILFLTGNTKMKMSGREKSVKVGFKYFYPLCKDEIIKDQMKELDLVYHNILNSKKYKPSICARRAFSASQLDQLNKLSFYNGYSLSIMTRLSRTEISEIKKAWKYA